MAAQFALPTLANSVLMVENIALHVHAGPVFNLDRLTIAQGSDHGLRCYQCNRLSTIIHLRTHYFWTQQHEREPVGRLVRLH